MFFRNKPLGANWCYLVMLFAGMLLLGSCVPTTLDTAGTDTRPAAEKYMEIKALNETVSNSDEPADAEPLIQKSRAFVNRHPKYEQVDEVYHILGTTLISFERTEEGIAVLEELIKYYPTASYAEKGMLELGLAYDKIKQHDKADGIYKKLVRKFPFENSGKAAQQLLEKEWSARTGESPIPADNRSDPNAWVGKPAPDFQVATLTGEDLSLEKYRGQVVLLDFWATWCGPCRVEMPHVKRTYEKYKNQKFEIIGISLDRSMGALKAYIEKEGIAWPQYLDSGSRLGNLYQVQAIPSTFLLDGKGIIRKTNLRGGALETAVGELVRANQAR